MYHASKTSSGVYEELKKQGTVHYYPDITKKSKENFEKRL